MDIRALPNPLSSDRSLLVAARNAGPRDVPVEPVLQGELLRGGQTAPKAPVRERFQHDGQGTRREDHPAFLQRHDNNDLTARTAVAAYAAHAGPSSSGRPTVDFFA
jgi:hypothetical protein